MDSDFVYAVLRVPRTDLPAAVERLRAQRPWLALLGGRGIGWHTDEIPVIAAPGWPLNGVDVETAPGRPLNGVNVDGGTSRGDVLGSAAAERLAATVRPMDATPLQPTGVVALRWFEVDPTDWDEFLQLSAEAWPAFESAYDANILGLFRTHHTEVARALLVTRYASIAEWERSRQALAAEGGAPGEAGRRFRRRHEITRRSIVRVAPPL